MSSELT